MTEWIGGDGHTVDLSDKATALKPLHFGKTSDVELVLHMLADKAGALLEIPLLSSGRAICIVTADLELLFLSFEPNEIARWLIERIEAERMASL
jgi:hypothetical protein